MKFSFRQILASTAGAVIAALIASTFGVKGTIIGVAIGSAAATIGTAFVAQSIERGHEAVKQVVRAPESSTLLRKLGATGASTDAVSSGDAAPTEAMPTSGADAETVEIEPTATSMGRTERLEITAAADAPESERIRARTLPMQPAGRSRGPRRFSWTAIAGTAAIVFVLALMFVTAVELISGKPLAAIFGNAGSGTSVHDFFTPTPSPTPTTSTTSTTITPSTTSTSTTSTSTTTTSTTATTGTSTTTTSPGAATTTTTSGTPAVSGTSTTTAPGP